MLGACHRVSSFLLGDAPKVGIVSMETLPGQEQGLPTHAAGSEEPWAGAGRLEDIGRPNPVWGGSLVLEARYPLVLVLSRSQKKGFHQKEGADPQKMKHTDVGECDFGDP